MKVTESLPSKRERKYERYDILRGKHVECSEDEAREFANILREQIAENDRRRDEVARRVDA
ncbi:hypothetical protein GWN42_31250 [candidate division KSB1 bacterium]|nr:hypothetical protein [Phycisphaerae bacterium]NIQ92536.1 hypothetical protein [Deltaproteobacteria bacterium]NIV97146.1 hypothetical protein [candidate division KSB1 bacterium]